VISTTACNRPRRLLSADGGRDDLIAVSAHLAIASYAGDLDSAKRYAEQALTHRTKNPALVVGPAYKTLGDVAVRRGAFDEAIALYGQAAAASSERFRPLVQLSLANAYVAKKDAAKARALYDALPALQGTLVPVYQRGLGNLLLIEDRPDARHPSRQRRVRPAGRRRLTPCWAVEARLGALLALGDKAAARARYLEAAKLSGLRTFAATSSRSACSNVQQIFDGAINPLAEEGDDAGAWSLPSAVVHAPCSMCCAIESSRRQSGDGGSGRRSRQAFRRNGDAA
jgi:hypothetical protein